MLSAYHVAATVNPGKAFRPKAYTPTGRISDPSAFWSDAWNFRPWG
jgi:hypothetical protein